MENTIFKPIDINVDLMKAVLSKSVTSCHCALKT